MIFVLGVPNRRRGGYRFQSSEFPGVEITGQGWFSARTLMREDGYRHGAQMPIILMFPTADLQGFTSDPTLCDMHEAEELFERIWTRVLRLMMEG